MADPTEFSESDMSIADEGVSPVHGYRGLPERSASLPRSMSIALSREAGSRGGAIARRIGARLGWEVYSQEMLEVLGQDPTLQQELADQLPAGGAEWIEERVQQLLLEQSISRNPQVLDLARQLLMLALPGEVILLGRGAGCVLPAESTLNVRLVAPLADRVAYLAQALRLTEEEATEQVRRRDHRRSEFLTTHFHRKPGDVHQYDLVLNTRLLGEEACADLIIQAAKAKMNSLHDDSIPPK
jgi:cytidylate kinase